MVIGISGLEVIGPLLVKKVSPNCVANVMADHNISMHESLALWAVYTTDVNLSDELLAAWRFL